MEKLKHLSQTPREILKESVRRAQEAGGVMSSALAHALWHEMATTMRFALAVLVEANEMDAARVLVESRYDVFEDFVQVTSWDNLDGPTVDEVEFLDANFEAVWNNSLGQRQDFVDRWCEHLSEREHERRRS